MLRSPVQSRGYVTPKKEALGSTLHMTQNIDCHFIHTQSENYDKAKVIVDINGLLPKKWGKGLRSLLPFAGIP